MRVHVEPHNLRPGDRIIDTWVSADTREDGTQYTQLCVQRPVHDLPRYWRIVRKYFRMRPTSLSWAAHVWDHVHLSREARRTPCHLKARGKCCFCD